MQSRVSLLKRGPHVVLKHGPPTLAELASERESHILDQRRESRVLKQVERGSRVLDQKYGSRVRRGPRIY